MKLQFKNQGNFSGEASSRYEAKQGDLLIRIFKCEYSKNWNIKFCTLNGFELETESCDYYSNIFFKGITKKDIIEKLEKSNLTSINEAAKKFEIRMAGRK
jgi:hypothetical protein